MSANFQNKLRNKIIPSIVNIFYFPWVNIHEMFHAVTPSNGITPYVFPLAAVKGLCCRNRRGS